MKNKAAARGEADISPFILQERGKNCEISASCSSSFMTNQKGSATQHLQYLPPVNYRDGETFVDLQTPGWRSLKKFVRERGDERERDAEVGRQRKIWSGGILCDDGWDGCCMAALESLKKQPSQGFKIFLDFLVLLYQDKRT